MEIFYKRKYLRLRQILSWTAVFTLLISLWPLEVFAATQPAQQKSQVQKKTMVAPQKRELPQFRTATTKLIDNGDGTLTKNIYFKPIHRKINGVWSEISSKLQKDKSGVIKPENTDLDIEFDPQMKAGKYVTLRSGKHVLSYAFLEAEGESGKTKTADVTPAYKDNRITHAVLDGVQLRNIVFDTKVKEDIVLSRYTGHHVFRFKVETDLTPSKNEDGSVSFKSGEGKEIFRLPKPYMVDSNIDPKSDEPARSDDVTFDLQKEKDAWILTLTADEQWLKDPARKYPVYIDPTTTVTTPANNGDTFVSSAYPTTNYENFYDSGAGYYSLKVGYYDATTGTNHAYLIQDLSGLKDVIVDSATLNVYTAHSYYVSTPTRVWVDEVQAPWNASTLTWNSAQSIPSTNIAYVDVYRGQWASFNVTNTVKAWLSSPPTKTNYGFKLHTNGNGQTYWKKFYASENSTNQPYLSVTYHLPTPNPPKGIAYANWVGSNSGFVDLSWDPVPGATGYYVWIFNGISYEKFNVGNVTSWSTFGKGIWPTPAEIAQGRYQLHTDGQGTELARDPSPVYRNADPNGPYVNSQLYYIKISAIHPLGETSPSNVFTISIPARSEDLGQEDYWTYAGVYGGQVNLVTGNLVLGGVDAKTTGRGPGVSLIRTYNSRSQNDGVFGLGWSFNYGMKIEEDPSGNAILTDEDGTIHQFTKNADGTYSHPPGVYRELSKDANGFTLTDKDQTKYIFDLSGRLTKIQDANNNAVTLTYNGSNQLTTIQDASGRQTTLTYNAAGKVDTVKDPANRTWTYGYTGNQLTSVTNPEGGVTQYGYAGTELTSVKEPNHTDTKPVETVYTYTDGRLTSVRDPLSRTTTISYDPANSKATVTEPKGTVTEYTYNVSGNPAQVVVDPTGLNLKTTFKYDHNNLIETKDPNANKNGDTQATESYKYDANGNVTEATDASGTEKLQYNSNNDVTQYTDANGEDYAFTYDGVNEVSSTDPAKVSEATVYDANGNVISSTKELGMADNQVTNPGMERATSGQPDSWTKTALYDNGTMAIDSSTKRTGANSVKFTTASTSSSLGYVSATQIIPVMPNTTYTLSGYIKTSGLTNANAFFNTEQLLDASGTPNPAKRWTDNRFSKITGTRDWTLRQVTFTTHADTTYVRIYLEVDHTSSTTSGTVWFDDIQLEQGDVSTRYNPLENSSFENGFANWSLSSGSATIDATESFDGAQSIKMTRASTGAAPNQYVQTITLNQTSPQPITVTGMSKASNVVNTVNNGPNQDYSVWVDAVQNDSTNATGQAKFSLGTHDWQRAAVTINPTKPINTVRVYVLFRGNNTGTVWFDNIRVQDGRAITTNEYDARGNYVTKTTDPIGYSTQSTYDDVGNQLTSTDPRSKTKTYTYDPMNRMKSVELPGYDIKVQYTYDKQGNLIKRENTSKDGATTYNTTSYVYDEANQLKSVTDPLNKVTSYTYDANGNTTKVTRADGSYKEYTYDSMNRVSEVKHNGATRYRFTYDANGNITGVDDLSLSQTRAHTYDKTNRMTGMTTPGGTVTWSYDPNDNVKDLKITNQSVTYTHSYNYNSVNKNIQVIDPSGNSYRMDYDENGNLRTLIQGNGSGSTYVYDDNDRIVHVAVGKNDGSTIAAYDYTYDENRNQTSVKDHTGKVINYTYDEMEQLTSETDSVTGNTIYYTYDPLGNRKTKVVKDPSGNTVSTTNYTYNAANQLISVNGQPLVYDDNGRLIDDGTNLYVWDVEDRLVEVKKKSDGSTIARYFYDDQGRRVRSEVSGVVTNYIYDGNSIRVLYETNGSNQVTRYYTYSADEKLLSMTKVGVGTYYYHTNAHGDVVAVTDASNNIVASYIYDAWGNILEQSGTFADENPYRYAGYRFDKETGLYYLKDRYYNAKYANFLSKDPHPGSCKDPETQNGYNYVNNNPLKYTDPDGNLRFRFWGNWCGPGIPIRGNPPLKGGNKVLDGCCRAHDKCYERNGYNSCYCDYQLIRCINGKMHRMTIRERLAAYAVRAYFSNTVCRARGYWMTQRHYRLLRTIRYIFF